MNITEIISTDYVTVDAETDVAKVRGLFEDPGLKAVVVETADGVKGVITRRQLAASHHPPNEKARSLVWSVPRVGPDEDVREVAQRMLDGDSRVLPVFDGTQHRGVVTADDLLEAVQPFLEEATVADAVTRDPVTVSPSASVGAAVHEFREHRFSHLPVVEDDAAVGIVSLYDVIDVTTRESTRSQGGSPGGFGTGTGGDSTGERSHGGFGARDGEKGRTLALPVRDLMVAPPRTVQPDATLETAVGTMFDIGGSSLLVESTDGTLGGIITKTDVLDVLTWEAEGNRAVQLYGVDLVDDISYDEIVDMIDAFDEKDGDMTVLDARVHFHEHKETRRGRPLILARIRLDTDRGLFLASGEGFGASQAVHEARDALARRVRDNRTYGLSKKHPDEAFWEKRFGWNLEA